ncbi:MAG TPA: DedA family protein [Thermoplasmata archaeon]|jgi:membrane protein DedA with SNARE-associated domain|nr:DedA family protein [Thermoplasmata archaeon]
MSLIEWGTDLILDWISAYGYAGIVFLMALESACLPVPSEIVMPFAGYLVYQGGTGMTLLGVGLAGALGCTVGSIVAYVVGMYAGRPLILRYGRYFLISPKHLVMAEKWFEKYGDWAAFLSRLMPIVRTFISLPAGIARMDFKKFVILSFLGSLPWTLMLAYVGYALGPNWEDIMGVFRGLDILIIAGAVAVVIWYVWKLKRFPSTDEPAQP